jgi:hypothetical protein
LDPSYAATPARKRSTIVVPRLKSGPDKIAVSLSRICPASLAPGDKNK